MQKIWTAECYCPICKRSFTGEVWSDNMRELPEEQKENIKRHFLNDHNQEHHIYCWKCKKHLKLENLRHLIAVGTNAEPLCDECAKSSPLGKL